MFRYRDSQDPKHLNSENRLEWIMDEYRNVVLLSIDALRADHLSCYGYERETSPIIDKLAAGGILFQNAYSQSSHTREAVPALLTGRDPDEAVNQEYTLATETIATQLTGTNITTGGFHSNPFVSRAYGFGQGFDMFDDDLHLGQHKLLALAQRALDKLRNRHYARASKINERAFNWIDECMGNRFFLWNHYMDVHGPYEPPEPYLSRFCDRNLSDRSAQQLYKRAINDPKSITESEQQVLIDLYDGEIAYIDSQIGQFIEMLRERQLWNETLIILTADHGDAFGEHGYYEHPRYLHEELTQVPLLVFGGNVESDTSDIPVSTRDIVPTIQEALNVPGNTLSGKSLISFTGEDTDRMVFSQARGEDDDRAIRRFAGYNQGGACFIERDLTDGSVCWEDDSHGDSELLLKLREYSRNRVGFGTSATDVTETDAVSDRLEALGYKE